MTQEEAIDLLRFIVKYADKAASGDEGTRALDVILANTLPEPPKGWRIGTVYEAGNSKWYWGCRLIRGELSSYPYSDAKATSPRAAVMAAIQQIKEG